MADGGFNARSAFAGPASPQATGAPAGLVIERLPDGTLFRLAARRGGAPALAERVRAQLGLDLPDGPRVVSNGPASLVGIGLGCWLALGVDEAALQAVAGDDASLFDWSDSRALLRVGGPMRREALAKGLPIDLHPRIFGSGSAAVTRAGHIGVTLWQQDESPVLTIAVARSYAADLLRWLLASGAENGVELI